MLEGTSVRRKSVAALTLTFAFILTLTFVAFIPGCVEFGPPERAMLNRLLKQVDQGIETFDIRGKQAIDVFGNLPAAFGKEGAKLIEFQMTEWGSAMFGKGIVAVDCAAEGVQQRCIKNLEMVKNAIGKAVEKVNELENQDVGESEKRSKWATFLEALRFEPVLLDPHICFLDHESVSLQYTDATATEVVLRLPSNGLLKVRGTGLQAPFQSPPDPNAEREPTFTVWVVTVDDSNKETGRKDISSCILYTSDNTIQLNLNSVSKQIGVGDSYIEIVTKADPKKKVHVGSRNQIPFVYLDPSDPDPRPSARVVDLIIGGRTDGENKDGGRGFNVKVYVGRTVTGIMPDYCYTEKGHPLKDADFPSTRFENNNRDGKPWRVINSFAVPNPGRIWVQASKDHDCEVTFFTLTYTVQTYKWGAYDKTNRRFPVVEDQQFTRKFQSPYYFFRANEIAWDFNWEGQ